MHTMEFVYYASTPPHRYAFAWPDKAGGEPMGKQTPELILLRETDISGSNGET